MSEAAPLPFSDPNTDPALSGQLELDFQQAERDHALQTEQANLQEAGFPYISPAERAALEATANAASSHDLPDTVPAEDRRRASVFLSNPREAGAALEEIRGAAQTRLAEHQTAHETHAAGLMGEERDYAGLNTVKARREAIDERVAAEMRDKHAKVKGNGRDMLENNLRAQYEAEAYREGGDAREADINARGGIENIVAIEREDRAAASEARHAAKLQAEKERADAQAAEEQAIKDKAAAEAQAVRDEEAAKLQAYKDHIGTGQSTGPRTAEKQEFEQLDRPDGIPGKEWIGMNASQKREAIAAANEAAVAAANADPSGHLSDDEMRALTPDDLEGLSDAERTAYLRRITAIRDNDYVSGAASPTSPVAGAPRTGGDDLDVPDFMRDDHRSPTNTVLRTSGGSAADADRDFDPSLFSWDEPDAPRGGTDWSAAGTDEYPPVRHPHSPVSRGTRDEVLHGAPEDVAGLPQPSRTRRALGRLANRLFGPREEPEASAFVDDPAELERIAAGGAHNRSEEIPASPARGSNSVEARPYSDADRYDIEHGGEPERTWWNTIEDPNGRSISAIGRLLRIRRGRRTAEAPAGPNGSDRVEAMDDADAREAGYDDAADLEAAQQALDAARFTTSRVVTPPVPGPRPARRTSGRDIRDTELGELFTQS